MSTSEMTAEEFAHKLWITESSGRLYDWGDQGLAMGPYQEHPDWLWTWAHKLNIPPVPMRSWAHWEGLLVRAFYNHCRAELPFLGDTEIAMYFHLGHISHEDRADWDREYAAKFNAAASEPRSI